MKMSLIVLLMVGVSASFAMPTTTAAPNTYMKDAVRMLLESSELLQNWGNTVIDASKTGLNAANVKNLMSSGVNARQSFHDSVEKVSQMMKAENGEEGAPASIYTDMAGGAVKMLKEEAGLEDFTDDDKLALIAGDRLAVDTMRMRLNMRLFSISMKRLSSTVSVLEGLLGDEATDSDIMQVLPELVEKLGSEGTALSIVFDAIAESFEDAANLMEPQVEEEVKQIKEQVEEEKGTPSRQRRSPSWYSHDLGGGWNIGEPDGLSWSDSWLTSRGNVNLRIYGLPTFGSDGIGARIGFRIEF